MSTRFPLGVRTPVVVFAATAVAAASVVAAPGVLQAQEAQGGYTIVVAPAGTPNASDSGPGTMNRPLESLDEAQSRARDLAARGNRNVTVLLLDGTYRMSAPLQFDAADSGRNGNAVTWRAASGASPVLSGAQPVTGWELADPDTGIYRADVGTGFDTRQLYVNGELAPRAKMSLPNNDITFTPTGFTLDNPNLEFLASLPDQQRIELSATMSFTHRYIPVESISPSEVVLQQPGWDNNTFGYDTIQHPLASFRIPGLHLENSLEFLTQPGEWYLDTTEGTLYYLPLPGQDLADTQVEVPLLETLLEVGGTYDEPASNLRFEGLTFTGTTWLHPSTPNGYANQQTGTFMTGVQPTRPADGFTSCAVGCPGFEGARNNWAQTAAAVQVSAAHHITFADNVFTNLGSIGLGIGNDANAHASGVGLGAQHVTVDFNTFTASAGGGIVVGGVRPDSHHPSDPRMTNSDITLSNNSIFDTAVDYPDNAAIFASYITRLTIAHNYVSDMPYTGIGIGYGWGANDPGGSPDYIDRGLYDFQPIYDTPTTLREVKVVGNHVRNVVNRMFDAGCFYFLSAMPESTIDDNYCENSGQLGLYFDEGARFLTGTGNVFVNSFGQWAHANIMNGALTGDLTLIGNYTTNPDITFIEDGDRGNVVADNVTFSLDDIPPEASRVIAEAGPADRQDTPLEAVVAAEASQLAGGESTTVTATLHNTGSSRVNNLSAAISVPDGWQAEPTGSPLSRSLTPGATTAQTWLVTAPESIDATLTQESIAVDVEFRSQREVYGLSASLDLTVLNPLTSLAGYGSVPSSFAEHDSSYSILTNGADIWEDAFGTFDEYGAIYQEGAAGTSATVTAFVTHMDNTHQWAKAGVFIRNDITDDGSSPGYAIMVVTPGNGVAFQWDADGNGYIDSFSGAGGITAPVWVRLVRSGDQISGYYSHDGSTWTQVGQTITLDGMAAQQDAGMIATSHSVGVIGRYDFSEFSVTE